MYTEILIDELTDNTSRMTIHITSETYAVGNRVSSSDNVNVCSPVEALQSNITAVATKGTPSGVECISQGKSGDYSAEISDSTVGGMRRNALPSSYTLESKRKLYPEYPYSAEKQYLEESASEPVLECGTKDEDNPDHNLSPRMQHEHDSQKEYFKGYAPEFEGSKTLEGENLGGINHTDDYCSSHTVPLAECDTIASVSLDSKMREKSIKAQTVLRRDDYSTTVVAKPPEESQTPALDADTAESFLDLCASISHLAGFYEAGHTLVRPEDISEALSMCRKFQGTANELSKLPFTWRCVPEYFSTNDKTKPILLLGLDMTLVCFKNELPSKMVQADSNYLKLFLKEKIIARPFLNQFLDAVCGSYDVAIFSTLPENIGKSILEILQIQEKVKLALFRNHCQRVSTSEDNWVKRFPRKHTNTEKFVFCDSHPLTFAANNRNSLQIKEFKGASDDKELLKIVSQLLLIATNAEFSSTIPLYSTLGKLFEALNVAEREMSHRNKTELQGELPTAEQEESNSSNSALQQKSQLLQSENPSGTRLVQAEDTASVMEEESKEKKFGETSSCRKVAERAEFALSPSSNFEKIVYRPCAISEVEHGEANTYEMKFSEGMRHGCKPDSESYTVSPKRSQCQLNSLKVSPEDPSTHNTQAYHVYEVQTYQTEDGTVECSGGNATHTIVGGGAVDAARKLRPPPQFNEGPSWHNYQKGAQSNVAVSLDPEVANPYNATNENLSSEMLSRVVQVPSTSYCESEHMSTGSLYCMGGGLAAQNCEPVMLMRQASQPISSTSMRIPLNRAAVRGEALTRPASITSRPCVEALNYSIPYREYDSKGVPQAFITSQQGSYGQYTSAYPEGTIDSFGDSLTQANLSVLCTPGGDNSREYSGVCSTGSRLQRGTSYKRSSSASLGRTQLHNPRESSNNFPARYRDQQCTLLNDDASVAMSADIWKNAPMNEVYYPKQSYLSAAKPAQFYNTHELRRQHSFSVSQNPSQYYRCTSQQGDLHGAMGDLPQRHPEYPSRSRISHVMRTPREIIPFCPPSSTNGGVRSMSYIGMNQCAPSQFPPFYPDGTRMDTVSRVPFGYRAAEYKPGRYAAMPRNSSRGHSAGHSPGAYSLGYSTGYYPAGYPAGGYPAGGYPTSAYSTGGYLRAGYPSAGYSSGVYSASGHFIERYAPGGSSKGVHRLVENYKSGQTGVGDSVSGYTRSYNPRVWPPGTAPQAHPC